MNTAIFRTPLMLIASVAVLLLPAATNSCLAQSTPLSSVAPSFPPGTSWHKIPLKYADPKDILSTMQWNNPTKLPEGVYKIVTLEGDNSIFIAAKPYGFSRVQDIVQNMDVKPHAVQIKIDWVIASNTDIANFHYEGKGLPPNTIGSIPLIGIIPWDSDEQLFASLNKSSETTFYASTVSTMSNTPVTIIASGLTSPTNVHPSIEITPRVNADKTVIFRLAPNMEPMGNKSSHTDADVEQQVVNSQTLPTLHTLTDKRMGMLEELPWDSKRRLLIFVTPTLLPDATADSTTTGTTSEGASQ